MLLLFILQIEDRGIQNGVQKYDFVNAKGTTKYKFTITDVQQVKIGVSERWSEGFN